VTRRAISLAGVLAVVAVTGLAAQSPGPRLFRGARLIPITGPIIESGDLLVQDGRIAAIGRSGSVRAPAGTEIVDARGKTIMPGLVDSHSHIGDGDGADRSSPIQGDVRILDALDARASTIQRAQAGGLTTVNVMPGSGHLMSGQTAYLKLRDAGTIPELLFCADPIRDVCGGLKMANGTNPRGAAPFPGTRAKAAALVRERYAKAVEYRAKLQAAGADSTKRPARDLELETLAQVMDGKRTVHFHTHRHDDILTVLRLGKEFGFTPVLHHVSEGYKVAKEIAAAGAPASVIVIDAPGGKLEAIDMALENAAELHKAGVLIGFHTDDGITDSRFFLRSAGLAVRAGLPRDAALAAMTLNNAKMLGLDGRVGSLERGKDADFIVLDGDPLSVYTRVEQTWVEGRKVFDFADPADRKFAVGGFGVMRGAADHDWHEGMEDH
jgi:imidazolonepropionase-like amidohydrolase